tara:strand:+ start:346 stop:648 length:303 start_codon:yes stop_codon:yes gene_type:complete
MPGKRVGANVEKLAMYFLEVGKVPTWAEYQNDKYNIPIKVTSFGHVFTSWKQAVNLVRKTRPDVWIELHTKPVAPKPAPKPAPKATAKKPVVKVASKKEK